MSPCPFAWDWMKAVTGPAGTHGCSLPEGQTFHDTAIPTNSAVTWPSSTAIGQVRITKSILRDKDPCALSDLSAETVLRNPDITAFRVRPIGADYSSLLESLSTRLPSDQTRIHNHYMAAHHGDAETPTTLRFASTKPKPATFAKEGWYKEAAKRNLFLFDPRQSGEETLPVYSLSSRSPWEWDGDGPGLTVPNAYAANGLLALPVTSTPLFVAHDTPLLGLPSDCPTAVNNDPSQLASLQHLFIRGAFANYEVEDALKEALAIAEERWAHIFNHNRPVGGRAQDPPDRKMVRGKAEDMSKHLDGEDHIQVWSLPCLTAMVTRVKATPEVMLGKTLQVMTQRYIASVTHLRQLPHRDFHAASLPVDGIALPVFLALLMDIPDDDGYAQFVAMSVRAFPPPGIIHRMPMKSGSLRVMCLTVVHEGGGLPLAAEHDCTRRELREGHSKLLPYVATAMEVSSGVVWCPSAAVCPLLEVVKSQLTLSGACGTFNMPRQDHLLIVICVDATPLWQTSATKCDIHVTVWSEGVAGAGDVRCWATWWALDGPDDTHCLRAIDTMSNLKQDVSDVLSTMDVWDFGNRISSVCVLTDDGKAMVSANYHKGKRWVGCHCIASLACIDNDTCFTNKKNLTPPRATSDRLSRNTATTRPCNSLFLKNILPPVISNFPALVGREATSSKSL